MAIFKYITVVFTVLIVLLVWTIGFIDKQIGSLFNGLDPFLLPVYGFILAGLYRLILGKYVNYIVVILCLIFGTLVPYLLTFWIDWRGDLGKYDFALFGFLYTLLPFFLSLLFPDRYIPKILDVLVVDASSE
jgi:hypothetical protein